ncbi:PREDICTED: GDSL esterase/lipase At5g03980-like [Nelumbo nucifera]|uniref:GDSL esterase/lipase At5g03980-like n=1 Tax=Nelumbo nucifera TaxID=4432 RepID=A0A1U8QA23_NELNU|nr:PREDICTED: GDSL esterase/lipase At5g03980-like [Nelumbo nucifera]
MNGEKFLWYRIFLLRLLLAVPLVPSLSAMLRDDTVSLAKLICWKGQVQLDWFKDHLKSICYTQTECAHKLERALFLVGEVGGNDYNYAFFQGKTIGEIQSYVPHIVQKIKDAARKVIDHGAQTVIVPGNFPIGCMPIYLTAFRSDDPAAYDELKCLKGLNNFAMFYNDNLQRALKQLRKEYPDVTIVYADYFTALHYCIC